MLFKALHTILTTVKSAFISYFAHYIFQIVKYGTLRILVLNSIFLAASCLYTNCIDGRRQETFFLTLLVDCILTDSYQVYGGNM